MTLGDRTARWVSPIIVLATGVVMGAFFWNTYFGYVPHLYPLEFKRGQWIVVPDASPQGYFRKELYIPESSKQAWIMVAATDSFILYLNGTRVGDQVYPMLNASGTYDIGPYLHPGKNVIGVKVTRATYPGPAKAAIEGAYLDAVGRGHPIISDTSWKAFSHEDSQGNGTMPWYTEAFHADAWPSAQALGLPSVAEISPVSIPLDLIASPPRGRWIGPAEPTHRSAIFYQTFDVIQKVQGAWVRIAAGGRYELTINSILVASRDASDKKLDIYDIGPFLRKGLNTIQVHVVAWQHPSPSLLLDGVTTISGQTQIILTTDSGWRTKTPDAVWTPVVVLADYSSWTDSLSKNPLPTLLPTMYDGKQTSKMLAFLCLILLMTLMAWYITSLLLRRTRPDLTRWHAQTTDALLHLPCLLLLSFVYLMRYDIRYDPAFPFQPKFIYLSLSVLLILKAGVLLESWLAAPHSTQRKIPIYKAADLLARCRTLVVAACLMIILMSGAILRLHGLADKSLSHDEAGMAILAKNIFDKGYPFKNLGAIEKPLTTYELLPYPIALSIALFGADDFAVRLPAAVLALLTVVLIYYVGRQLWGIWTGILAAAIYAFSPFSILWGTNAFHPQQTQFFALLTSFLFYKAIELRSAPLKPLYLYGASISFIFTYLSWEASGLLLPAFLFCTLAIRGSDFTWLKSRHLWLALLIAGTAIFIQISRRILLSIMYIIVGQGLSDSAFTLSFLTPIYDPMYYVENFLFSGTHIVLTVFLLLAFPFLIKHSGSRYYLTLLITLLVFLTNLIPRNSIRYTYFILPFLFLPASATVIHIVSSIWGYIYEKSFIAFVAAKIVAIIAILGFVFLSSNTIVLHLYRLGDTPQWIVQMTPDIYWIDYRSTNNFIKSRLLPNDLVISLMPQTLEYYTGLQSQYYLQEYTDRQIFYDVSGVSGKYLDKYIGSPVIRSHDELHDVVSRYRRVYLVAVPYDALQIDNSDPVLEYIKKNFRVIYESYKTRVYLWEK
jgi:4-amino-4-deoxy-L-arabinose transferase-like glycosyltransferase